MVLLLLVVWKCHRQKQAGSKGERGAAAAAAAHIAAGLSVKINMTPSSSSPLQASSAVLQARGQLMYTYCK